MIGSLLNLVRELNDDELAALTELAIAAVNGEGCTALTFAAERLAMLTHDKRKRMIE